MGRKLGFSAGIGLALVVCTNAFAVSAAPTPFAPQGVQTFADLVLSPDGALLATVDKLNLFEAVKTESRGAIVVRDAKTGARLASYDPCATCTYDGLAWAPDGEKLAFIASDHKAGTADIYVATASAKAPVKLTRIDGVAGHARWSPDGKSIAFLATPGAHKLTGAVEAGAAQVGDLDQAEGADEQRIAIIAATGGAPAFVSPADTFVYEYGWMPDSKGFVATAAKGNGDNNWWVAKLVAVPATGGPIRVIAQPSTQLNFPTISADGKTVAFIGGLMSDFGSVGGNVYTVPFSGGAPVDITPTFKGSFTALTWRGGTLYGTALMKDKSTVLTVDPATGATRILRAEPASFSAGDGHVALSADGAIAAAIVQDFEHAPAIYAGPVAAWSQRTHDNDALAPQVEAHSVSWTNEGLEVQGWLLAPRTVAAGLHPLVMVVHGGPSAAAVPAYISAHPGGDVVGRGPVKDLIDRGYFIFMPNPRGSYGQGEAFTRANYRDFGGGDLRDDLAGIDAVEKIAPVDDKRLGVFGHSYGGYMTMWIVTHSQRFKAAVAGAGVSDWISYYGENGIDEWMPPFFGDTAYNDPAIYQKLSPLTDIKNAHTPTFLYVGERDVECPEPQTQEFWRALKTLGVPTKAVVYEGEGHAIRKPANILDIRQRELAWFDQYLKP